MPARVTSEEDDVEVEVEPTAVRPAQAPSEQPGTRWHPAAAQAIADRASTEEEQHRFAAALGSRFTDLLALVNAAMATWPVLREGSAAGKADLVAVCLYLSDSPHGALVLNEVLRSDATPSVDGYLPCLVSGLRQLPLHRRAVLCQARVEQPVAALYPVGAIVTEPAPVAASVAGDVTVPEADVDFLVWPRTARQTSVLVAGNEVDEAVFGPGRRLRVLAVVSGRMEEPSADLTPPATAVLLRERGADEEPAGPELDETDRAALGRLEAVLVQRWASRLRKIEDPDLAARLVGPPLGYVSAAPANRSVGAA